MENLELNRYNLPCLKVREQINTSEHTLYFQLPPTAIKSNLTMVPTPFPALPTCKGQLKPRITDYLHTRNSEVAEQPGLTRHQTDMVSGITQRLPILL